MRMGREETLSILQGNLDELPALGVASPDLFGPALGTRPNPDGDVDLLGRGTEHPVLREGICREATRVA